MFRALRLVWAGWKSIAHVIGVFQTKLILTIFYALVFAPVAMAASVWGRLRSAGRASPAKAWLPRKTRDRTWADLRRQS